MCRVSTMVRRMMAAPHPHLMPAVAAASRIVSMQSDSPKLTLSRTEQELFSGARRSAGSLRPCAGE